MTISRHILRFEQLVRGGARRPLQKLRDEVLRVCLREQDAHGNRAAVTVPCAHILWLEAEVARLQAAMEVFDEAGLTAEAQGVLREMKISELSEDPKEHNRHELVKDNARRHLKLVPMEQEKVR